MRRYICIFFYLLWLSSLAAQTRIPYEFRHLNISNGLPDNTVYSCLQDSRGYIWFCTANGASRFDGRKFQNFDVSQGLADSEIITCSEDSQGRIWFQTINGRLSYFDTKTEQIVSYRTSDFLKNGNSTGYLTNITEGVADSSLWVLTERYALKRLMPNGKVKFYDIKNKLVMGIFKDEQNHVFLAGDTFRLYNPQNDSFDNWLTFPRQEGKKQFGRWHQGKAGFFFEMGKNIFEFKKGVLHKIMSKDLIKNQVLRSISSDTLGNIWLGVSNGFYCFNQNNLNKPRFYPVNAHVSYIFIDKEGNKWVCTLGDGVFFFPTGYDNITTVNKVNGLETDEVTALAMNPQGDIVMGVYPNRLYFWDKKNERVYRKIAINSFWDVRPKRLFFPNKHDFWLQTDNYKLDFFSNFSEKNAHIAHDVLSLSMSNQTFMLQQNVEYTLKDILNSPNAFKNIYFAKNGRIYIVSSIITELTPVAAGHQRFRCRLFYQKEHSRFYSITEDRHGTIWFGGIEGVYFLRRDSDEVVFLKQNFETTVNDMITLSDDYILCCTTGNGVFLLKNNKIIKNWRETDGLSSNTCNRLLKFNDQTVFLATAKGVTRLSFDPNDPSRMYPLIYGGKDPKPSLFVNDLLLDDEKLYIASNNGLYSFKINDLKIQKNIPIVRLTQPMAYLIKPDSFLQLHYGWFEQENEIKFNFRAIAFCNGEVMHFRYRLFRDGELIKKDSIALREDFTLSLVSLNSGLYTLEVETSRGDDIWSKPLKARFEVPRAIYRKPATMVVYWLLITFFTFQLLHWLNQRRSREAQRAIKRREERVVLERRHLELEQETVRAQIDPHFVFNALNGILTLVYKRDIDSLKIQLPRLARFIRLSLNLGREDFISIEQEIQYLNDYLNLEKKRFDKKFDYSIAVTEGVDVQKKILPPLLLQIFVENAVRHGISSVPEGQIGFVSVVFENREDGAIYCVIKDNGKGLPNPLSEKIDKEEHNGMGLNLAQRRIFLLNQLYKQKYTLHISQDGGVKVELIMSDE